jgi:hypothetical protein
MEDSGKLFWEILTSPTPSEDDLLRIMSLAPEVCSIEMNREYPLSKAIERCLPDTIILNLIDFYPDGCRQVDLYGRIALQQALLNYRNKYDSQTTSRPSNYVLTKLIQSYPESCAVPETYTYCLPLHTLLCNGTDVTLELVSLVTQAYPKACQVLNVYDKLPLHVAIEFHQPDAIICYLIDVYPQACAISSESIIPLQMAIHEKLSLAVLHKLIVAYPKAIFTRTKGIRTVEWVESLMENYDRVKILRFLYNEANDHQQLVIDKDVITHKKLNWNEREAFIHFVLRMRGNIVDPKTKLVNIPQRDAGPLLAVSQIAGKMVCLENYCLDIRCGFGSHLARTIALYL